MNHDETHSTPRRSDTSTHGGHGGGKSHSWMMIACCIPMLAIAIALVATGVVGVGFIFIALVCTAMIAMMHGGMSHGGGREGQSR